MFVTSIFFYLLSRKLQILNVDNRLVTYAFCALPLPTIFIYNLIIGQSLTAPILMVLLMGLAAILFSYLGFKFSTDATKLSPNPGFSLVIQKSYAPYTALMGILLFGQSITIKGILGILIIILFTAIMLITPRRADVEVVGQTNNNKWIWYSFAAFFLFGSLTITGKYFTSLDFAPSMVAFYTFLFNFIAFSFDYRKILNKTTLIKLTKSHIIILILIGILVGVWNVFMYTAIKLAPNIGYVNIINASSNIAITVFSAWIFKDKLGTRKIIGVIGVIVGLAVLFL